MTKSSADSIDATSSTGLTLADEHALVLKTLLNLADIIKALGHTFNARQRAALNFCLAILGDEDAEDPA